jgi:epoxyqueuosine reductase QueG
LERAGYPSLVPNTDARFWSGRLEGRHTSLWSERHIAYIAGLGTFGLSRGIITRRGMAGRFGSLVTAAPFLPDEREYEELYQYCTRCGVCVRNCPAGAISLEHGKDNLICCTFLDELKEKYGYRRGCGQCQVAVPCESGIPVPRIRSAR